MITNQSLFQLSYASKSPEKGYGKSSSISLFRMSEILGASWDFRRQ